MARSYLQLVQILLTTKVMLITREKPVHSISKRCNEMQPATHSKTSSDHHWCISIQHPSSASDWQKMLVTPAFKSGYLPKPSVVILIGQQKKQISVLDILFSRKIHKFKPPVYWLSPVRGKLIFQSHFIMYTSTSVTSQGTLKTPY